MVAFVHGARPEQKGIPELEAQNMFGRRLLLGGGAQEPAERRTKRRKEHNNRPQFYLNLACTRNPVIYCQLDLNGGAAGAIGLVWFEAQPGPQAGYGSASPIHDLASV